MTPNSSRTVVIYRDTMLPTSETFIKSQAESLTSFDPFYVCLRRTSGVSLPESRVRILCEGGIIGRIQRDRFKLLGASRTQIRELGRLGPVLFHAHFAPNACDVLSLVRSLNIPLVVSLHGYDINSSDRHLPWRYLKRRDRLKSKAARFICISQFMRKQALAKGFPDEKLVVHYTGIDTTFFSVDPVLERDPLVLFVGRLIPGKGCEDLIRAMGHVQKVLPGTKLVIIGDGPQREELKLQAAAHLRNFVFLGAQPAAVVKDWMTRAKVFSVPCYITSEAREGFGMVFAEAQSMGLPVVSSSIGGIPEAVADGQSGFLVPERDWEGVATKLLVLLQNKNLWTRFSDAGRKRVTTLFDIRKQTAPLEKIYEDALSEWTYKAR